MAAKESIDFEKELSKELEDTCLPNIDLSRASVEDIVRDIHMLMAGNGGPQRGIIYKLAATRATVGIVRTKITSIESRMAQHKLEHATADADLRLRGKVSKFCWNNKSFILLVVFFGLAWLNNMIFFNSSDLDKRLDKIVNAKLIATLGTVTSGEPNSND